MHFTHFATGQPLLPALSLILTWSDEALLAAAAAEGTLALALFQFWLPQEKETEEEKYGGHE